MTIIISKDGKNAVRVEESGVGHEIDLEHYVAANPESLPLDDIQRGIEACHDWKTVLNGKWSSGCAGGR